MFCKMCYPPFGLVSFFDPPETFDLNKLDCFEHVACYHNYEFHSPAFVLKMNNLNIFCLFLCILDPWSLFEISFRSLTS